ncbi:unnamed protein product [Rotaria sp. Silwood2]|nr:unnamed protein product [Rotaria sp. Silwood2]
MELPSVLRSNIAANNEVQNNEIINKFFLDRAFNEVETKIQYVFQTKAYLIAAFTHSSSFANLVTDSYER